jgi:ribosomal 30S subunit maturation factor RimM
MLYSGTRGRDPCKKRSFGGRYRLHHQGEKHQRARKKLTVIRNLSSSLMMKAIRSSETSVLTSSTRRHISENTILHSHRREDLKHYITLTGCALYRRRNMSPVMYERGFYITEDGTLYCRSWIL